MKERKSWVPEIMYEEDVHGEAHTLPFIIVPPTEVMPSFILIWEHRDTGEIEPGPNGEEIPIVEADLKQYASMSELKDNLSRPVYDIVRNALGLESLQTATLKGQAITDTVLSNAPDD
jgi:hypothetical protein